MHVLTKIFVVLVSLLAVLLVPLVVVYSHNEDSYKAKYDSASAQAAVANQNFQTAQLTAQQLEAEYTLQLSELTAQRDELARAKESLAADLRRAEIDLTEARSQQAGIRADLATLASATSAGQDVIESLLTEVRAIRTEALSAERRAVELDEALRDVSGQLESAVAARRAVQEELQQLKDEHARALQQMAAYVQKFGRLEPYEIAEGPVQPTVDLDARVVSVRRGSDRTLAEINVGERDGVEIGWVMQIGRAGSFLANLQIIAVDINHATGVVELEDPKGRGQVEAGDTVYARRSRG